MRIAVVGVAKSGTTALLYAVRSAMPTETVEIFEPQSHVDLESANVVAKILLNPDVPIPLRFYRQFDRIVVLVRDPRDILVSKALYRVFGATTLHAHPERLRAYFRLLQQKERDPRSLPLRKINSEFVRLTGSSVHTDEGFMRILGALVSFHRAFPSAIEFRYEDLVARRFTALGSALSLSMITIEPRVPDELSRVARTLRAGNWRSWFCAEDVEHYRPLISGFMARYGYADEWLLDEEPTIRPEECSAYVLRLLRERIGTKAAELARGD